MPQCSTTAEVQRDTREAATDDELLNRLRRTDPQAAEELFRRYGKRVHALARARCGADLASRLDAEDIVQCVFRTFFSDAAKRSYHLKPGTTLWNLLAAITVNAVRSQAEHHRAAKRDVRAAQHPAARLALLRLTHEEHDAVELRLLVSELLERMTAAQRHIVQLRLDGHQVEDIMRATGTPRRTVERVLHAFRDAVRREC